MFKKNQKFLRKLIKIFDLFTDKIYALFKNLN
jgi:hypothetical protein